MCSSRFFSLNSLGFSTISRSRFVKKAKSACLKSGVRSGNGRSTARWKNRRHSWEGEDMKIVNNIRLYLKNNCIMEENKRLREIALLLSQENQALQSHIQNMNRSNICTISKANVFIS